MPTPNILAGTVQGEPDDPFADVTNEVLTEAEMETIRPYTLPAILFVSALMSADVDLASQIIDTFTTLEELSRFVAVVTGMLISVFGAEPGKSPVQVVEIGPELLSTVLIEDSVNEPPEK